MDQLELFKNITVLTVTHNSENVIKKFLRTLDINLKLLATICYEIIYAGSFNNNLDYDFIINISEDGWFGNSIGPYQHYVHSKFRSIDDKE